MTNDKNIMEWINDEQVRNNAESIIVAIAAIAFVIITKGFISGFSWNLFMTLDPYASGVGVGIATSLIQNNMIGRAIPDEIADNKELQSVMDDVSKLDVKITDYEYAEYFLEGYNKTEYNRLQKVATDKEVRRLKYLVSIKKSLGRKYHKLERKLNYVIEYGAKVKKYTPVSLQDLLSFQASNELKGKDRINFNPITSQRKAMAKSRVLMLFASGIMAGLPLVAGEDGKELVIFLAMWIPLLGITALRTYINSRKIAKTTYFKSLQFKKNILQLCIDNYNNYNNYSPPHQDILDDVIEFTTKEKATIK